MANKITIERSSTIATLEDLKKYVDRALEVAAHYKQHPSTVYVNDARAAFIARKLSDGTHAYDIEIDVDGNSPA